MAYVTNRAIQNRLDEVFGIFGWRNEFTEWKGGSQLCGISVKVDNEWITKWDGAADSNMEAVKGGLSDAMKRAAYQWGIGRYLYKLPSVWVGLKGGKYLAETPQLPTWALPEGYKPQKQDKYQQAADEINGIPGMNDPDRAQVEQLIAALKEQGKWQDSMKKAAHESALAQGLKTRTPAYYQHVAGCLAKEIG